MRQIMKIIIANGKKQAVLSKEEWTKIGKEKGWIPKKLFASETKLNDKTKESR